MSEADKFAPYDQMMNKILAHFAGPQFADEVQSAKAKFFENSGILDEKAPTFELRMCQFFDWFFFTRELSGYAQTPVEASTLVRELRFSPAETAIIEAMKSHRHSLFEFIKLKSGDLHIRDLLKNEKLVIQETGWKLGFNSDEIFEARLIPVDDSWVFTKGFCFHPAEARRFISDQIKRHRKDPDLDPDEMMLNLNKMRYRFDRMKHFPIDAIYTLEERGR